MNRILFVGEHPKTFDVRWHSHEHWEMVYCTSGKGCFRFENGSQISYREGEVVVIPPYTIHSNVSDEGFTNIHITMADPAFRDKSAFRFFDDEEKNVGSAFAQAKYYYMGDLKHGDLVLAALGDLIASYIIVRRSNEGYSEPVEKLRSSIRRNYSRTDYALDETIRAMPFNYDYLRKLFKKEVGMSPLEYLTSLRMKSAQTLLTAMWTNEYSVAEVAQMCGYDDALYFSRVFKKYYGCAPRDFSKNKGKNEKNDQYRREFPEKDFE